MSQELLDAVVRDDLETVRSLLDAGADINTRDAEGRLLLMVAARAGQVHTMELLLDRGADVDAQTERGGTPLMSAAKAGMYEAVRLLLNHGASVNAQNKHGATALLSAVMSGNASVVTELLDAGADPNLSARGSGPLHFAASLGHTTILRILIDHGATVNVVDSNSSMSPLGSAVLRGRLDSVQTLLQAGANPDGVPGQSLSPLRGAIVQGHAEIVRALLDHGVRTVEEDGVSALVLALEHPEIADIIKASRGTDLHDAAAAGDRDRVMALLEEWPEVDRRDDRGRTALMMAAESGQEESVRVLLERGADPNAADQYQHNSLIRAAAKGYTAIVKRLLDHGADVAAANQWGQTALHRAATAGREETMGLLIASGAAVGPGEAAISGSRETLEVRLEKGIDLPGAAGMTALMGAAAAGRLNLVQELLDRGANPSAVDSRDQTALHWAVNRGHLDVASLLLTRTVTPPSAHTLLESPIATGNVEMIRLLMSRGVDANTLEEHGSCPLRTAVIVDKEEALEALLDGGADANGPIGASPTPLAEAARMGQVAMVRILLNRGADPDRADENGRTALEEAADRGHLEVVSDLLDAGAHIKVGNRLGAHVAAAMHGHTEILRLLIERSGFEMLNPDEHGFPIGAGPLLIAAALGKTEIVDLYRAGGQIELPETVKKILDAGQLMRGKSPDRPPKTSDSEKQGA